MKTTNKLYEITIAISLFTIAFMPLIVINNLIKIF